MEYHKLGSSGIKVSEVSLGSWTFSGRNWGEIDDNESIESIRTAIDLGMNFIDTARGYGRAELVIGEALKGRRDKAVICTKVVNRWQEDGSTVKDCSYGNVLYQAEQALERLQTDYLDVYLIHNYDPDVPIKETMSALAELLDQKIVRAVGVSRYNLEQLEEASRHIELHAVQYPLNIIRRCETVPLLDFCHEKNIGVMAFAALAKGLLTGKFTGNETFPEDDNRRGNAMFQGEGFRTRVEAVEKMKPIADKHGKTLAQLAINWNLCQKGVTTATVGARRSDQVTENAGASGWRLEQEDLEEIEKIVSHIEEPETH